MNDQPKFTYRTNLSDVLVYDNGRLIDAIAYIRNSSVKSLIVVDDSRKLKGHLSDGDVRRFVLNNGGLEGAVSDAMVPFPLSTSLMVDEPAEEVLDRMDRSINLIPVVQGDRVVGAYLRKVKSVAALTDTTLCILAGGLGLRMRPLTTETPKPMLLVKGKPILEHIIVNAARQGIKHIIISVGYLFEKITDYFGDGTIFGVNIIYVHESEPLGTAGSLSLIEDDAVGRLIVMNGDLITGCDFESLIGFHENLGSDATVCVKHYEIKNPYGAVNLENFTVLGFEEKPVVKYQINAGIYVLEDAVWRMIMPSTRVDMPDLLEQARLNGSKVCGFPLFESWSDIGNPTDLANIQNALRTS